MGTVQRSSCACRGRLPLKLLLVEDDFLIRMNTAVVLRDLGHDVIEAGTAAQAISAAEATSNDILLTDIGLPDMQRGDLAVAVCEIRPASALSLPRAKRRYHRARIRPPFCRSSLIPSEV